MASASAEDLTWLVAPPESGEPLELDEVLNLLAAITIVAGVTPEELGGAVRALREGPDLGPRHAAERALERRAASAVPR